MWKIIFWTEFLFLLFNLLSVSVFAYANNYEQASDSDSMESYLENSNNFYGRKYTYNNFVDPAGTGNQITNNPSTKVPIDRKINSVDDEELMETGDENPPNDVDFQDSSEVEVMIVGENESPKDELLKRAKRYLSQINLAAYTPASPFYSYYNPNFGQSAPTTSGESQSNSDRESTASSINSRTMESLLASCQLTNLLLYRAVNQKTNNQLSDPIGTGASDYARTVQHVPLAIGTFGAILEGNLAPRWPSPQYSPAVSTKAQSQPLQTYITTRSFITTMTSTEVLRQGATLSTHLRIIAFKTSKVHTLYFTKDITPSPVLDNPKPTTTIAVTPSSIVPRARVDDHISRIIGENRQNRTIDTNRQKRKNPAVFEEALESSEEQFDKDDEYAAYQYGAYRCPPMETETTTKTKTVTIVDTVTRYINPSPSYVSSSSLRTLRSDFAKRAQKTFEPTRRIPFRPVGRLYSFTRASYN